MAELLLQQLSLADDFTSMRSALKQVRRLGCSWHPQPCRSSHKHPLQDGALFLLQARDLRIRDPELVAKYGSELLSSKHRGRLTTEEGKTGAHIPH